MASFLHRFRMALPIMGLFLTIGATSASHAALLSYSDPTCDSFDLQNNGNGSFTLICVYDGENGNRPANCSVTLSTPAVLGKAGGPVSISGSCATNATSAMPKWIRVSSDTGNATTYSDTTTLSHNLPPNNGSTDIEYTYTFFACHGDDGASCSHPISRTVTVLTMEAPVDPPSNCSISGPSSLGTGGGSVSLTASCTGTTPSTTYAWTRSGGSSGSHSGQTWGHSLPSNTGTAGVAYNYSMVACNGAGNCASAATWTVTVQGSAPPPPPAPTSCTISQANQSLTSGGGPVTWTASCSGTVTAYNWTRTGGAAGQQHTGATWNDSVPANTSTTAPVTYTYSMTACNGESCATAITRTATVAAATGGSSGTNMCGQHNNVITRALKWGDDIEVPLGSGVLSASIAVPATVASGILRITITPKGGWITQNYTFSENACDFSDRTFGNPLFDTSYQGVFSTGANTTQKFRVTGGKTYHLNVRNRNAWGEATCTGSCTMRIQVFVP